MADEKKQGYNPYSKSPLILGKGLFTDTNEEFQPDGTYRFALNANLITNIGEKGALTNEEGNRTCIDLHDDGARVIGNCLLNDGRVILFVYHSAHAGFPAHSSIIIQNEDCIAEWLIRSECLGFLPTDVINCEYKIQNGCDIILYFTDRRTKYKSINISKLESYLLPGYTTVGQANVPSAGAFGWDCGLFNFSPDYSIPEILLSEVVFGGRFRVGTYFVALRYLDVSLNPGNFTATSNPIYITYPINVADPMEISGGLLPSNALEDGFYITSKSIRLIITNLDTRYKYFQLGILEYTQGTATNNVTYISTPYNISDTTTEVLISELSPNNGFIQDSSTNIVVPKEYIGTVRAHAQVDRRLLLGNLANEVNDWSVFQRAANEIKSLYFTYDKVANISRGDCATEIVNQFQIGDPPVKGAEFNQPEFLFDQKTYMRDEIYAFGIVYIFKNGQESPVFHIPGRPAISDVAETTSDGKYSVTSYDSLFETFNVAVGRERWYFDFNDNWATGAALNGYYDNFNAPVDRSWDRTILTYEDNISKPYVDYSTYDGAGLINTEIDESQNILDSNYCSSQTQVERWEFVNTSIKFNTQKAEPTTAFDQLQLLTGDRLYSAGLCGYYETNTQYPNVLGCDGLPIFPHSIVDDEVVMHRIRHHRMPDARKERIYEGLGTDDANTLMSLKPLGMFFYNIPIPTGYDGKIQGYYIVRGDRSGNKTVVDKGWLNVCDTSVGVKFDDPISPTGYETTQVDYTNTVYNQQNPIFMVPTEKFGTNESGNAYDPFIGYKKMHITGSNYVEFFSPKSSFNEPVNLQGSYYKLENTVISTKIKEDQIVYRGTASADLRDGAWSSSTKCDEPEGWESYQSFKIYGFVEAYDLTLPRMFAFDVAGDFNLIHNVPIIFNEYTLYNQNNLSAGGITLNNDNHRQTIMISKLYNEKYGIIFTDSTEILMGSMYKPLAYFEGSEPSLTSGNPDLINPLTALNSPTALTTISLEQLLVNNGTSKELNSFREEERAHFYYAALKAKIIPYSKLEDIIYLKASNQVQTIAPSTMGLTFDKGGDCFISKQRLFKSFVRATAEDVVNNSLNNGKLAGTVIVGYVESEINAHFRHKFNDDLNYYFRPIDGWKDSLQTAVEDVHLAETTLVDFIEHLYRYNLDFSVDNRNRVFGPLPDVFDYCSECSERFPHTFRYSEPSISTQTSDNYKIFLSNSIQEIPTDTGEITNLFVKDQNLFVHTVSNIYRLNLAPQSLETSNDQIQVGSGTLANAVPQRLLDNGNGYGRGGTEFEHSGVFCNDVYIWVDNKSKRVYALSKGLEELSAQGMNMWFRNNLTLTLRDQWRSITRTDYPFLNTSDRKSIGFIGGFDPYFDRYILHKKDYELPQSIIDNIKEIPNDGIYVNGRYYYDSDTIYRATSTSTLVEVNFENDANIKNKSFTISYSLQDKAWASFHSYRPNHIWNNNFAFFTTINNVTKADYIWQHNVRNYQNYYGVKHDFIYDYVAKGEEPIITKAFDSIEIMGNTYEYNTSTEQWRETFYSTFDRLHVYNNTQSSGLFNLVVKNPTAYYDITNNFITSRTLSINRSRDVWKVNNLADYTNNVLGGTETINSTEWILPDYSNYFTANENMGYIDWAINPAYINTAKSVYELQRFRDKFLNVRLFYKPNSDYKIVINTMANLKRALL